MSTDPVTVRVRGEGGWEFDQDIPAEGTLARGVFDKQIAKGQLVVVSGDYPAGAESSEATSSSELPAKSAKKADWVAYAVSQGVDRDVAEGYSKDDLVALYTAESSEAAS